MSLRDEKHSHKIMIFDAEKMDHEEMKKILSGMSDSERQITMIFYLRDIAVLLNQLLDETKKI